MNLMHHWTANERGNVLLTGDEGELHAYLRLPFKGYWLEISYRPQNYPSLNVASLKISDAKLAAHINQKLVGMWVRKGNLEGLNVDKEGQISEAIDIAQTI